MHSRQLCTVLLFLFLALSATMFCRAAGTVNAWGADDVSQTDVPPGLGNVTAVAAGESHSLALKTDGTVVAWGYNFSGQTSVPAGLSNVVAIAAGASYSLALKADGTVAAWGDTSAAPPAGLANVIAIAGGRSHSLALKADRTVVAWGSQANTPDGLTNIIAVAAGDGQSLALGADGSVMAWGDDSFGKAEVPPGLSNVVAIAAGRDHCLALQSSGTVVAWGGNTFGQAAVPSNLGFVSAITAGARHSLALKTDGSLAAWGDDTFGQVSGKPGTTGFIGISAGSFHNLAIRGDGTPVILLQPLSIATRLGTTAAFRVAAVGAPTLRYQWEHEGTNIAGATRTSINITNVQLEDGGAYVVVVTNSLGSVTSNPAILTPIGIPPEFVIFPQDTNVICGESGSFQGSAQGSKPITYQWDFQGQPIDGATNTTLVLTNVSAAQAGLYSLTASNAFGTATTGAVLTVTIELPQIASPLTATGMLGAPFSYTIQAIHTPVGFSAVFLPDGLTVDTTNGIISGIPSVPGTFGTLITALNACTNDTELLLVTIGQPPLLITSATNVVATEGQPFTYRITALNNPTNFAAQNLPFGLFVDPASGIISGTPTFSGQFDSTIWAISPYNSCSTNLHFTIVPETIDNIQLTNVTYTYSAPYVLDFGFSLFRLSDVNDPASPTRGVSVDPALLSATCKENGQPISPDETGSFIVRNTSKVLKVYVVLDYSYSIASLDNGDTNYNGISDAVDFMVAGAQDFVDQQAPNTQIGVYEFHRDDWSPSNVVGLITDKVQLDQKIAGIYTNYVKGFSTGSRCWDALSAAVTALGPANPDEQHYVILVSDGQDTTSSANPTNIIAAAKAAAVKIFCLGFGAQLNAPILQFISGSTVGNYYEAATPADLATQFSQISKDSKAQYVLRWATLQRPTKVFSPSFTIYYQGLSVDSPTNTIIPPMTNIDTTTDPPTTNVTPGITNIIIADYYTASNSGPVTVGLLRVVPDIEVLPTGMTLRTTYTPHWITQLRFHYRPNWPCTAQVRGSGPGDLLAGWSMIETTDDAGGKWMLLSSPNPVDPRTAIPFASFGNLVTFTFQDVINPTNAFSFFDADNSLYTNGGGQSFVFQNTNSFLKVFPPLPYGTPVPWLMSYGITGNFTNAEVLDSDGDGAPNWQEYRANTNPTNAASVFKIGAVTRLADGRFQVTFSSSTNRIYRVESSADLSNWQLIQDNIVGNNQDINVVDTRYLPNPYPLYYRVRVY